jgi:hypothetical protein
MSEISDENLVPLTVPGKCTPADDDECWDRMDSALALQTLANISMHGKNEAARVSAANSLIDRGWGKAASIIQGDEDGGAITVSWQSNSEAKPKPEEPKSDAE